MTLERMLAGRSTRRYTVGSELVGVAIEQAAASTRKSTISDRFIQTSQPALAELIGPNLSMLEPVAVAGKS
jgi:hypothetical protein